MSIRSGSHAAAWEVAYLPYRESAEANEFRPVTRFLTLLAFFVLTSLAQPGKANWTGPYQPCLNSAELKSTGDMTRHE